MDLEKTGPLSAAIGTDFHVLRTTPALTNLVIGYREWYWRRFPHLHLDEWDPPLRQLTTFHAPNVWVGPQDMVRILTNCLQVRSTSGLLPLLHMLNSRQPSWSIVTFDAMILGPSGLWTTRRRS
jgi:hypothetical protein